MLAVAAFAAARPWFAGSATASGQSVMLDIPRGTSRAAVAGQLRAAGLIGSERRFRLLDRLFGSGATIRAGRYALDPAAPWRTWMQALEAGDVLRARVTIPEGSPSLLVAERLMALPDLVGDIEVPPEGSVLPETYDYTPGETRAALLGRMQAAMAATLAALWPERSPAAAVGSPEEAVILASIVEKETARADEYALVAAVYSNRLRLGMKLDADPTVIYPVTRGRPLGRRIRRSELEADTGWNTYVRPGLPKTPITNPGRAALRAVLAPAETDALYFVADGQGGHVFAATLAEHNRNVAAWYRLRRSRGEM